LKYWRTETCQCHYCRVGTIVKRVNTTLALRAHGRQQLHRVNKLRRRTNVAGLRIGFPFLASSATSRLKTAAAAALDVEWFTRQRRCGWQHASSAEPLQRWSSNWRFSLIVDASIQSRVFILLKEIMIFLSPCRVTGIHKMIILAYFYAVRISISLAILSEIIFIQIGYFF